MKLISTLIASAALMASSACFADQPNMEAALASLQQAKESLQKAVADKGGHRVKAMKAVDAAIAEVQAGIEYAKKNK
jgi:F0F1-type ATP synthase epsilon subunit